MLSGLDTQMRCPEKMARASGHARRRFATTHPSRRGSGLCMLSHTPNKKLDDELVLFAPEAAAIAGTSVATLWRWVRAGKLVALDFGDRRVFRKVDVEALRAHRERRSA